MMTGAPATIPEWSIAPPAPGDPQAGLPTVKMTGAHPVGIGTFASPEPAPDISLQSGLDRQLAGQAQKAVLGFAPSGMEFAPPGGPATQLQQPFARPRVVQTSKGGRTPQSWQTQTTKGVAVPEEAKQLTADAYATERAAAEKYAMMAMAANNRANTIEAAGREQVAQEYNDAFARSKQQYDTARATAERAAAEAANPTTFWEDRNTGDRIAGAIAMAAGQWAAILGGGPNVALQIIDKAIERDIASKRDKYNRATGTIARLKSQWGDEQQALSAARAQAYELVGAQAGQLRAVAKSQEQAAALDQTMAELDRRRAAEITKIATTEADKVVTSQTDINRPATYATVGGAVGAPGFRGGDPTKGKSAGAKQLAKDLAPILERFNVTRDARAMLNRYPGQDDVPGLNYGTGLVAKIPFASAQRALSSEEALNNNQVVQRLGATLTKQLAGPGAVSDSERQLMSPIATGAASDPRAIRNSVEAADAATQRELDNVLAGADPNDVALYLQRGGKLPSPPAGAPASFKRGGK
jgi:hypothetical protein